MPPLLLLPPSEYPSPQSMPAQATSRVFQHHAARGAYEDAKSRMQSILETIKIRSGSISQIQSGIEQNKREASEAHQEEQKCITEQDALIPLEQAARQKVAELKSNGF
ncbi:hypothetical protein QN277_028350 [Acacia crassicarpa]|uniref:Uncharacterized protein n=1 Tax=Acacia crassicarpa TaxID=499986 RepID=A0AAE1J5F5_9FABA|nr:hypothetical protein QN277_028350 [Acacia crassicarpa]